MAACVDCSRLQPKEAPPPPRETPHLWKLRPLASDLVLYASFDAALLLLLLEALRVPHHRLSTEAMGQVARCVIPPIPSLLPSLTTPSSFSHPSYLSLTCLQLLQPGVV